MTDMLNLNNTLPLHPSSDELSATLVSDELRVDFWPQHFGNIPQCITLEPRIFAWMDRLCADYHGGIWQFYMLSNGGAFMAPEANEDTSEKWSLFNSMNGNGPWSHVSLPGWTDSAPIITVASGSFTC
ncbi:antirestriction protein [Citrobacter sp. L55]|uniref:antirestriction protein n=1 Tax=Citrobacter sp. L55 TaxID=1981983 RepID=UPI000C78AEAE